MLSSTKIRDYIKSDKYDFKMFPLKLSDNDKNTIANFKINSKNVFEYYGDLNSLDFKNFFSKVGENNSKITKSIEKIIKKVIKKVLSGFDSEYYWLSVRVSLPNKEFDIPRWHYDGPYFKNIDKQPKFAMVLKGPGTLVIKKTSKVEKTYNEIKEKYTKELFEEYKKINSDNFKDQYTLQRKYDEKYRPIFAKSLSKFKIQQLKNNQGLVFWGGRTGKESALHSEPKIDEPRMFISILPSTKENILEKQEKQKEFEKKLN